MLNDLHSHRDPPRQLVLRWCSRRHFKGSFSKPSFSDHTFVLPWIVKQTSELQLWGDFCECSGELQRSSTDWTVSRSGLLVVQKIEGALTLAITDFPAGWSRWVRSSDDASQSDMVIRRYYENPGPGQHCFDLAKLNRAEIDTRSCMTSLVSQWCKSNTTTSDPITLSASKQ